MRINSGYLKDLKMKKKNSKQSEIRNLTVAEDSGLQGEDTCNVFIKQGVCIENTHGTLELNKT